MRRRPRVWRGPCRPPGTTWWPGRAGVTYSAAHTARDGVALPLAHPFAPVDDGGPLAQLVGDRSGPARRDGPFLRRLLRPQHTGGMSNAWQDLRILTGNDWRSVRGDPSCVRLRRGAALSDPGGIPLWKRWQDVALARIAVAHEQIRQSVVFCGESALAIHGVPSGSPILTWSSPAGGSTRPRGSRASASATNACPGFGCAASPGSIRCTESGTCAVCQWRTFGRRVC